jgi:hypothetical protein
MQKPDLDRMWETYIRIGLPHEASLHQCINIIRSKIYPMISSLKNDGTINWYHFLIHENPDDKHDPNLYFHIRFDVKKNISSPDDLHLLDYCEKNMTKKVEPIREITGLPTSLLRNEEIEEAWRIIGEQAEWIIKMLNIHKENVEIPISQIIQFMHYFLNMLGLGHRGSLVYGNMRFSF